MSDQNVRASDPRNYQLSGKVSLWFKKTGASSFLDLGNVVNPEFIPTLSRLDHFSNRRGVRAKDKSLITERGGNINVTIDEINLPNLQFAFMSKDAAAASTVDVEDNKIFANPGSGLTIALGADDLVPASVIVRNENHEDEVTFTENVDYTVDYAQGILTIKAGGGLVDISEATGNPRIHVQWTKNVETQSFEIFPGTDVNGQAKLQILTDEGIKIVALCKNVNMRNNGSIKFGDGTKYGEIGLQLEILEDSDGDLGFVHTVNQDELP